MELCSTAIGMRTNDILSSKSVSRKFRRFQRRTDGGLCTNGSLCHSSNTFSTEVVSLGALDHESLKKGCREAFRVDDSVTYLFIVSEATSAFCIAFATGHEHSSMIDTGSITLVH